MKLENSKLFTLYIHEILWLSISIKNKCEKLFSETQVPESGGSLQIAPELHALIASLLSDAANIKKIFHGNPNKRLHKNRGEELRRMFESVALEEILDTKIRNSLEHFDEYLDKLNNDITRGNTPDEPMAGYNMIISHWEVTSPRLYPIRLYVASERCFYNMKFKIDIEKIYSEAKKILDFIHSFPNYSSIEQGGLMLTLS